MSSDSRTVASIVLSLVTLVAATACRRPPEVRWVPPSEEYSSWSRWPNDPLDYPIPGHLNSRRVILINEVGKGTTIETQAGRVHETYPEGTVIIKEIYSPSVSVDTGPERLVAMVRSPEHPQARGGWIWVTKDLSTGKEQVIEYELCFDCHADANEPHPYGDGNPNGEYRDYVFFPYRTSH